MRKRGLRGWKQGASAAALAVLAAALPVGRAAPLVAGADTLEISHDDQRTGWFQDQPSLQPAQVAATMGLAFDAGVTGQVYATPLIDHDSGTPTMLVVTEANQVYWLNPATGTQQKRVDLTTNNADHPIAAEAPFNANAAPVNCGDMVPTVGITSTPVIDTSHALDATHDVAYFIAKSYVAGSTTTGQFLLHARQMESPWAEEAGFPTLIPAGAADNQPSSSFNPTYEHQRAGLLLSGSVIYAVFAGHCDKAPYAGWVMGLDRSTGSTTARWVDENANSSGSSAGGSGSWMSGGGPVSDGAGSLYIATGNGNVPTTGGNLNAIPGHSPPAELGELIVHLTAANGGSGGTLSATDFFMACGAVTLNNADTDLGSGGIVELPASFGTSAHPNLLVAGGKEGVVYLLDRDNLGGALQGSAPANGACPDPSVTGRDAVLEEYAVPQNPPLFGKVAVWGGDGGYVYTAFSGNYPFNGYTPTTNPVFAFKAGANGTVPQIANAGQSHEVLGWATSPIVTSTNSNSGSAVVWVEAMDDRTGTNARLLAYEPVPQGGFLKLLQSFDLTTCLPQPSCPAEVAQKLTTPVADNGRVYVATREAGTSNANGHIHAYAPLGQPAMSGPPVAFGTVADGGSVTQTVTLTASAAVQVNSVSLFSSSTYTSDSSYSIVPGSFSPPLPASVPSGGQLTFQAQFAPTSTTGTLTGAIQVVTAGGTTAVSLTGVAQAAQPAIGFGKGNLDFGVVPYGAPQQQQTVSLQNLGNTQLTVNTVSVPPLFSAGGVGPGTVIPVGQSIPVNVGFTPPGSGTGTQHFSPTLSVTTTSGGPTANLALTAAAAPPGRLDISSLSINYGNVAVGSPAVRTFTVTNGGGVPERITLSKPPAGPDFVAGSGLDEGSAVAPGQTITVSVTFTASRAGPLSDDWPITGFDGTFASPKQDVLFSGTGVRGGGYWMVASDGGIFPFGDAGGFGSHGGSHLNAPIVAMARTPDGGGYWLVASDGGIFPYGDVGGFGSHGGSHLNQPIVGMAPTLDGRGYWLVASDGGIFPYGDAAGYGSHGGSPLNQPIVGMAATADGGGYWLVAADGGIFPYGDAVNHSYGGHGGSHLNRPIVAMQATHDGNGYWLVASDGGIFPYGEAPGLGSTGGIHLNQPIVGMAVTPDGGGYWLVASDGGVFPFGDAPGFGSLGGTHLNQPIVGVTGAPS